VSEAPDWSAIRALGRQVLERGEALELNDETRVLLRRSAAEVALSPEETEGALRGVSTAATLLKEIQGRIRDGSRRLSRARSRAKDFQDAGDLAGARKPWEDVLAVEPVPFYRELAELELDTLSRLEAVLSTGNVDLELDAWAQVRLLVHRIQQGKLLVLNEPLREFLRRTAPTVAMHDAEAALVSVAGTEALLKTMLERIRDGERRITQALYQMMSRRDAGDLTGARGVLEAVLAVEVVPRYRQMAEENLAGLDEPPHTP
jgi:DUSAM domain-containing protein